MSANISSFISQLHNNGDQVTVHFCIRDRKDSLKKQRTDSIQEFSLKRERSKSEAVNDISVSAVNQYVQMIIEKEFSVFSNEELGGQTKKDKNY